MTAQTSVLLSGVVGSTAYGLAGPDSDIDRLGVFACPTTDLLGLGKPKETHHTTDPDVTLHEAGKWCRLALGGNPTVMELVWLDDYETVTPLGDELVGIRTAFLSARRVRDAYLGYATQQFRKLATRDDGSFSANTRKRTEKHARHLLRLLDQGTGLHVTGTLTVRLAHPERYLDFGKRVADGDIAWAAKALRYAETVFNERPSVLAESPDYPTVEAWLQRVRRAHLEDQ